MIDVNDITPLWVKGYYDGPLSGMCIYNGEIYFFALMGDWGDEVWSYGLFELTEDELLNELTLHQMFREMVGTHQDFVPGTWQRAGGFDPERSPNWMDFYTLCRPYEIDHSVIMAREPVGMFER